MFSNSSENLNIQPMLTLYTKLWYVHIFSLSLVLWLQ